MRTTNWILIFGLLVIGCAKTIPVPYQPGTHIVAALMFYARADNNSVDHGDFLHVVKNDYGESITIPASFRVNTGNAGNALSVLVIVSPAEAFTCGYQGGSPVLHPVAPMDIQAGLSINLVSCTNGKGSGDSVDLPKGSTIGVRINGDNTVPRTEILSSTSWTAYAYDIGL